MMNVSVSPSAEDDLDLLWEEDEDGAAEIETALEEIGADPRLMGRLTERKFRNIDKPAFDVDVFEALWKKGYNLYRLKFWDWTGGLLPYRVIYAHDPRSDIFHVLAVVPRDFDYDPQHPIIARVRAEYEQLGIPTY